VCNKHDDFKEKLKKLKDREIQAFIVDSGVFLEHNKQTDHAISVFVERKAEQFTLIINDSEGNNYYLEEIKKLYSDVGKINKVFLSKVNRQKKAATCHCFAIDDCKALNENPRIFKKIINSKEFHPSKEEETIKIEKLPKRMMALINVDKENKLDLQLQLIEHFLLSK